MSRDARLGVALAAACMAAVAFLGFRSHEFREPQLDHRPYPLRAVDLRPPAAANGVEYYGRLRLRLHIGADGVADRVEMVESTLPASLQAAAAKAFTDVRWEPGRKWGLAVGTVKVVEVNFAPPSPALGGAISPAAR